MADFFICAMKKAKNVM